MRGCPLTLKCPRCKRGKWNCPRREKGVRRTGRVAEKMTAQKHGNRIYRGEVQCLDCGHVWWSTHPQSGATHKDPDKREPP